MTRCSSFRRPRGFTLIELMVVVALVAIASAGVAFALRDGGDSALEREAARLAALLESGRAQSRARGVAIRWLPVGDGFRFEGAAAGTLPDAWQSPVQAEVAGPLVLGPEPVIGPQAVVLRRPDRPERALRIATDGLRPFAVQAASP